MQYSDCLFMAARDNKRFDCAGCQSYEKPSQIRVDEFEEELKREGQRDKDAKAQSREETEKLPIGEEEMTVKGRGRNQGKTCDVTGCDTPAYCLGKCMMHYSRLKRGQAVDGPRKKPGRQSGENKKGTTHEKRKGPYLPKGPKASDQSSVKSNQMAKAVEMLIQCGFLKREKLEAAMELVRQD